MKKSLWFVACGLSFTVSSCDHKEKYPGYSETTSGLLYKVLYIGDGEQKAKGGDVFELVMNYRTIKDSVFLDSRIQNTTGTVFVPSAIISFRGSFEEYLMEMSEGDSVSFILSADSVFKNILKLPLPLFISGGEMMKIDAKLLNILNPDEYISRMEAIDELTAGLDLKEALARNTFIEKQYPGIEPTEPGLYFISLKEGKGLRAERGKTLLVKYRGTFLDGKEFDNSCYEKPLEFTLGEQEQVIHGLERGIPLMREGGKAKFILSSQLAFGENGSSTGIVPPYTSVVYEVELLKVN